MKTLKFDISFLNFLKRQMRDGSGHLFFYTPKMTPKTTKGPFAQLVRASGS